VHSVVFFPVVDAGVLMMGDRGDHRDVVGGMERVLGGKAVARQESD
jgi:hypothetical protein